MIDRDIIESLADLNDSELKRVKLLIDNKLDIKTNSKISYRTKNIKCGKETCAKCPHGPYWYAEWTENGKRKSKYLGKRLSDI